MPEKNGLLESAEKYPKHLPKLLKSYFGENKKLSADFLSLLFLRLIQKNPSHITTSVLPKITQVISRKESIQLAYNILSRIEVALNFRKPSIGIYDCAFHFIGGAQKYGCTIAHALQKDFDITLITNREITLQELQKWYNVELSGCRIKIVKIPYFEKKEQKKILIDPADVDLKEDNPFHIISKESGNYDIFVNNCMLEMVYPLANISVFVCHFPERRISRFFYVDSYTEIVCSSLYAKKWIKERWNLIPQKHIYPPVDMESPFLPQEKENIILSVARFDMGGCKLQIEKIMAFDELVSQHPEEMKEWKLVLAGGSVADNQYLDRIKALLSQNPEQNIELKVNITADELKTIYQRAKLFWHFRGLSQSDPAKIEHFGMTTVEAMQNGCVPIVFNGGGQREIVEDHVSGILFSSQKELLDKTIELIMDLNLLVQISEGAFQRGKRFNREIFTSEVKTHFNHLLEEYRTIG